MYDLRQISEFFPKGTQMRGPGGLSIDLAAITSIEVKGEPDCYIVMTVSSRQVLLTFHRNVDGGYADVYAIKTYIEAARHALSHTKVADRFVEATVGWNGFHVNGDQKSVDEVKRLISLEERLRWFEREYKTLTALITRPWGAVVNEEAERG